MIGQRKSPTEHRLACIARKVPHLASHCASKKPIAYNQQRMSRPRYRLGNHVKVPTDVVASHDGSAVCCVGMWNPGDWVVEKFFV